MFITKNLVYDVTNMFTVHHLVLLRHTARTEKVHQIISAQGLHPKLPIATTKEYSLEACTWVAMTTKIPLDPTEKVQAFTTRCPLQWNPQNILLLKTIIKIVKKTFAKWTSKSH